MLTRKNLWYICSLTSPCGLSCCWNLPNTCSGFICWAFKQQLIILVCPYNLHKCSQLAEHWWIYNSKIYTIWKKISNAWKILQNIAVWFITHKWYDSLVLTMSEMHTIVHLRCPGSSWHLVENVTEMFFNLVGYCFSSPTKFLCRQIFKVYECKSFQKNSR